MKKYYVTMTDKCLSGWGKAEGKINKLIFECDTYHDAEIVADNAEARGDQKYINITPNKPYYAPGRYYAQTKTKEECSRWYEAGFFRK
jgi:hypothetical protein